MGIADIGYRGLVRPVLFRLDSGDAESAHLRTVTILARLQKHPMLLKGLARLFAADAAPRTAFGLTFPNPVGLAAGADKDGLALAAWPALGFGFVEAGTVTAHAQPGNPRPRVFRMPTSGAVINRMGFPNAGAAALAARIATQVAASGPIGVPLGISVGKSKITPLSEAAGDYLASLRAVATHADYVAVNVSSPNTPGLRGLQDRGALDELIAALVAEAASLAGAAVRSGTDRAPLGDDHHDDGDRRDMPEPAPHARPVPILVKIAPDLDDHAVADVLQVCHDRGIAGVIATNTTIERPGIATADRGTALEPGGLSGAPLHARALDVVRFVTRHTGLPVIGVGGISSADDALAMLDAGAALVQVYTGMLYRGPGLNGAITRSVRRADTTAIAASGTATTAGQ